MGGPLYSTSGSSPHNPQVIFYDGYNSHFNGRALDILWICHIKYFIIETGESVYDHPNDNGPNFNINNMFGNAQMNRTRNHGTLKFMPSHMNNVICHG